ncbi:MAG TPA: nucleoside phosphorylase [Verrucomicrobiae bacterium]|nr:nucleoside phosphorylase [Verrucomicrobiae bacterium]
MPFPNFRNKHANDSLFSPADFLEYQRKQGRGERFRPPEGVIFCYQQRLMDYVLDHHKTRRVQGFYGEMYLLKETQSRIAILGRFGIGAPIVVTLLEELIAFGVRRFISVGTAGTLQKSLHVGDLVVCDRAIRDEGTSYHYLKSSKYAYASRDMTDRIRCALGAAGQKYVVGTSWTTDAPYRETVAEARQYQKEGVATVEMEASALFAVAQYRGVEMGAMFTISDSLAELRWAPNFHSTKTRGGLETLYTVALSALLEGDRAPKRKLP